VLAGPHPRSLSLGGAAAAALPSGPSLGPQALGDYIKGGASRIQRMPETVGFIGLGVMGKPMAKNLLARGYSLVVHSRSRPPVDELVAAGALGAASPAEVATRATRIITMLPDSPDVARVLEGERGVFSAMPQGTILIDMSSIAPAEAKRLAEQAAARGATMLDAPVSGGEIGAINATLSIMVGGDARAFATVKPILDAMGNPERVMRIGDSGAGQICKVCNQMVIGGTLAAVSEAFALAMKAGVDPARVRDALLGGFAASRVLEVHGERMLAHNYKPGFRARLYAKDLRIASQTQADLQSPAPVSAVVHQLVTALVASGRGDDDYAALATVLFELAGVRT
jgi:2-hydroxy-3-oxopropionate reductase